MKEDRTFFEKIIIVAYYTLLAIAVAFFAVECTHKFGSGIMMLAIFACAYLCFKANDILKHEKSDADFVKSVCIRNVINLVNYNTISISKVDLMSFITVKMTIDNYFCVNILLEYFVKLTSENDFAKLDNYIANYIDTHFNRSMHKISMEFELESAISNYLKNY